MLFKVVISDVRWNLLGSLGVLCLYAFLLTAFLLSENKSFKIVNKSYVPSSTKFELNTMRSAFLKVMQKIWKTPEKHITQFNSHLLTEEYVADLEHCALYSLLLFIAFAICLPNAPWSRNKSHWVNGNTERERYIRILAKINESNQK